MSSARQLQVAEVLGTRRRQVAEAARWAAFVESVRATPGAGPGLERISLFGLRGFVLPAFEHDLFCAWRWAALGAWEGEEVRVLGGAPELTITRQVQAIANAAEDRVYKRGALYVSEGAARYFRAGARGPDPDALTG